MHLRALGVCVEIKCKAHAVGIVPTPELQTEKETGINPTESQNEEWRGILICEQSVLLWHMYAYTYR
jgi:hypothetical protein